MEWLQVLEQFLDPSVIFKNAYHYSFYLAPLSGVLIVVTSYLRVIETQLSSQSSLGEWGLTLRDIGLWTFVLSLYTAFVGLLVHYVNDIYRYLNSLGSIDVVLHQLDLINKANDKKMAGETGDNYSIFSAAYWSMLGQSAAAVPGVIIVGALYQISLVGITIIAGFFRIVHAIFFSVGYAIGFLVIPLGISKSLRITQGWKLLWYFVILWPMVEALVMGLFSMPLLSAVHKYLDHSTKAAGYDHVNVLLMFTLINGVALLVMISALVLTALLVLNSNPITPMALSVMSMTKLAAKRFKRFSRFK